MKQVIVTVDGSKVTVDAVGFAGGACEKATEAIEAALGVVQKKDVKAERYAVETVPTSYVTERGY